MYTNNNNEQSTHHFPDCLRPSSRYKLARAYVPYQIMDKVYSPKEALKKGTLFPELYMPFKDRRDDRRR